MDFRHKRASGIYDAQLPFLRLRADTGRDAVSAENKDSAYGDFIDRFHEDCAAAPQLIHNVTVVHDFMMNVNRTAVGLECEFDDVHRSDHARAESPRPNAHQRLAPVRSALNVR